MRKILLIVFLCLQNHVIDAKKEPIRIMVFAPHQDDDIIGCGGSIAKHVKHKRDVTIVYMTSATGSKKYSKAEQQKIRDDEARQAATVLGVTELIFLRQDDRLFTYKDEIAGTILQLLQDKKPHVVYIPHKYDAHADHMLTYVVVMQAVAAAKSLPGSWVVPTILSYEVWTPLQTVSHKENISDYIDLKMDALQKHQSQLQDKRYDDAIKGLNHYRGIMLRKGPYCECFELIGTRQDFMEKYATSDRERKAHIMKKKLGYA